MKNTEKIADSIIRQSRELLRMPSRAHVAAQEAAELPPSYAVPHVMSIAAHKAAFGSAQRSKE